MDGVYNIQVLLRAAEFLERRERGKERALTTIVRSRTSYCFKQQIVNGKAAIWYTNGTAIGQFIQSRCPRKRQDCFWKVILRLFLYWLSDLHIGRIIVVEGANLVRFENEPLVPALPPAMKGAQKKAGPLECNRSFHALEQPCQGERKLAWSNGGDGVWWRQNQTMSSR